MSVRIQAARQTMHNLGARAVSQKGGVHVNADIVYAPLRFRLRVRKHLDRCGASDIGWGAISLLPTMRTGRGRREAGRSCLARPVARPCFHVRHVGSHHSEAP